MARKTKSPKVDVIVTVFNEASTILDLVSALKKQTLRPHEVVIVDGGSKDDTFALLKKESSKWPTLRACQATGNRSVGRNLAIAKTSAPIIAITDAGCIPKPNWIEEIVKPFSDPHVQVVSGYYQGLPQNIFQACLVPYVLVMPDKAGLTEFYPSTRSMALRRSAWNQSGGFDPKLFHNEDYAYAHWLKKMGIKFVFAREAIVGWLPRKNLRQAAWMFMRFAIGDAQSGTIRPQVKLLFIRYLLFVYLFFFGLQNHWLLTPLVLICLAYLIWAIIKNYHYVRHPQAVFWLPVLQLTADFNVMFGTAVGLMAKANGLF